MEKKTKMEKMEIKKNKIFLEDLSYIYKNIYQKYFFKKKILIVGSEGFLGFYFKHFFIKYFQNLGIKKLYFADNSLRKRKIKKNIQELPFDIVKDKIEKIDKNLDIIIHAASIASPIFYRKFPLKTTDSNVVGLRKILDYSKTKKSKVKILYFSTSEIYGDPSVKNIPTSEDYRGNVSCTGPRACYDESKRFSETLCYIYAKYYKVPVIVVRPFNNFGPGLKISDGRLPADLANAILKKKNIIIHSNGKPTRSFCYISDAIIGFLKSVTYPKYEIFNIGNDKEEISVSSFANLYKQIGKKYFNYSSKVIFKKNKDKNYLVDNPNRRCPNISKARKLLKFSPKIGASSGIERYLLFLKYKYNT